MNRVKGSHGTTGLHEVIGGVEVAKGVKQAEL